MPKPVTNDPPSPQPPPLQVFLRQKRTCLYYARDGGWTVHQDRARIFADIAAASLFACQSGLSGLELVLKTEQGDFLAMDLAQVHP